MNNQRNDDFLNVITSSNIKNQKNSIKTSFLECNVEIILVVQFLSLQISARFVAVLANTFKK